MFSRHTALVIAVVLVTAPPAVAQQPTVVRVFAEMYRLIVNEALSHPGSTVLLQRAVDGMDRALRAHGIPAPITAPVFSGQEREDLAATVRRLEEVMRLVPAGAPAAEVAYAAIKSMVASLGDRWTTFYTPAEWLQAQNERRARMEPGVGVGVRFGEEGGRVAVVAVIEDAPAAQAGVLPSDVVVSVDGQPVGGRTAAEVQQLTTGEEGQAITLELLRPATGQTLTVTLTRVMITVPPVTGRMIAPQIAYLRLRVVPANAEAQVAALLRQFQAEGARGLALDLRGNPGGIVVELVFVASHFIADGPVVTIRFKGDRTMVYRAVQREPRFSGALTVLVDQTTFSGAEALAGSLQDYGAKVVGERTGGADVVLLVFTLADGSVLQLTVGRISTRSGRVLGGQGVTPDAAVALGAAVIGTAADLPLQTAVRILSQGQP